MKKFEIFALSTFFALMSCSSPSDSASSEIGNPSVAVTVREPDGTLSTKSMAIWTDSSTWHSNLENSKAPMTDTVFSKGSAILDFERIVKNDSVAPGILEVISDMGYLKVKTWKSGDTIDLEAWQEVKFSELSDKKVWLEGSGLSFQAKVGVDEFVKIPQGLLLNDARFFAGENTEYSFWKGVVDSSEAQIKECKFYTGKTVSFMDTMSLINDDVAISALQIISGRTLAIKSFSADSMVVWSPNSEKKVALNQGRFQTSVDLSESELIVFDIPGEIPVCIELNYKPVQNVKKVQWVLVYPNLNLDSSELLISERVEQEAKLWQSSLAYLTKQASGESYTFTNVEKAGSLDVLVMESDLSVNDFDSAKWDWTEIFNRLEVQVADFKNTKFVIYKMSSINKIGQESQYYTGQFTIVENSLLNIYPFKNNSWDRLFSSNESKINYENEAEMSDFGQFVAYQSGGAMSLLLASMAKYDGAKTDTTQTNFQTGGYGGIRSLFTTESNGEYLDPSLLYMESSQVQDLIDSGWISNAE
jgi:hypothetical protein